MEYGKVRFLDIIDLTLVLDQPNKSELRVMLQTNLPFSKNGFICMVSGLN